MNDQQLDQVLHEWKAEPRVPADFRARVWERIADRQENRAQTVAAQLQQWLAGFFLKPAPVIALAMAMLTLGAGMGWWTGRAERAEAWRGLEVRYVQSIDPYARIER